MDARVYFTLAALVPLAVLGQIGGIGTSNAIDAFMYPMPKGYRCLDTISGKLNLINRVLANSASDCQLKCRQSDKCNFYTYVNQWCAMYTDCSKVYLSTDWTEQQSLLTFALRPVVFTANEAAKGKTCDDQGSDNKLSIGVPVKMVIGPAYNFVSLAECGKVCAQNPACQYFTRGETPDSCNYYKACNEFISTDKPTTVLYQVNRTSTLNADGTVAEDVRPPSAWDKRGFTRYLYTVNPNNRSALAVCKVPCIGLNVNQTQIVPPRAYMDNLDRIAATNQSLFLSVYNGNNGRYEIMECKNPLCPSNDWRMKVTNAKSVATDGAYLYWVNTKNNYGMACKLPCDDAVNEAQAITSMYTETITSDAKNIWISTPAIFACEAPCFDRSWRTIPNTLAQRMAASGKGVMTIAVGSVWVCPEDMCPTRNFSISRPGGADVAFDGEFYYIGNWDGSAFYCELPCTEKEWVTAPFKGHWMTATAWAMDGIALPEHSNVNYARFKPVNGSNAESDYSSLSKVTDGSTDPYVSAYKSNFVLSPFVEVNLGGKINVGKVRVWSGSWEPGLDGFMVQVDGKTCGASSNPTIPIRSFMDVICDPPINGQLVRLSIPGKSTWLAVGEVEVYVKNEVKVVTNADGSTTTQVVEPPKITQPDPATIGCQFFTGNSIAIRSSATHFYLGQCNGCVAQPTAPNYFLFGHVVSTVGTPWAKFTVRVLKNNKIALKSEFSDMWLTRCFNCIINGAQMTYRFEPTVETAGSLGIDPEIHSSAQFDVVKGTNAGEIRLRSQDGSLLTACVDCMGRAPLWKYGVKGESNAEDKYAQFTIEGKCAEFTIRTDGTTVAGIQCPATKPTAGTKCSSTLRRCFYDWNCIRCATTTTTTSSPLRCYAAVEAVCSNGTTWSHVANQPGCTKA
eukprot:comp18732_c1_seq1/m.20521 comp18732_c1_seq1/g.20521  ORF comp18732_c1_seq1/g.20521 comp18732_c1_seq1/m.20521 type:complete len:905 (-) comp18732_c1_seq1:142-2856(-)